MPTTLMGPGLALHRTRQRMRLMLHGLACLCGRGADPERSVLLFEFIDLHACLTRPRQAIAAVHLPPVPRADNVLAVETSASQRSSRMKAMAAYRAELAVPARKRHGLAAEADFLQLDFFQLVNTADAVPVIGCRAHECGDFGQPLIPRSES